MEKILLAVTAFLFFCPFIIQADINGARNDLKNAANSAADAALYAQRAYSTVIVEQAQFNARKAEKAAADTQQAIQSALSNLD